MNDAKFIPVIIPSLEPDERLLQIIKDVQEIGMQNIIIVNDGSSKKYDTYFQQAEKLGCTVLAHAVNLGKGRALKTAFNHCLQTYPTVEGVVTADSDGQHTATSILSCATALISNPQALVLGCRNFTSKNAPAKNRIGNQITAGMFRVLYGIKTTDTQTGLRGVPINFMQYLLTVAGERFEYETNMLIASKEKDVPIVIVPIETIYQGENYSSHFRAIRDSFSIYKILIKFIFSSVFSTVVDFVLFGAFIYVLVGPFPTTYIAIATVLARICSATINYTINREAVFHSSASRTSSIAKYILLSVIVVIFSSTFVTLFYSWFGINEMIIKAIVDTILFCINFFIQREFVFKDRKKLKQ